MNVPDHRIYGYYQKYRSRSEGGGPGRKGKFYLRMARQFEMPVQACKDAIHREQIRRGTIPDEPRVRRIPCPHCDHRGGRYVWDFIMKRESRWGFRERWDPCEHCAGQGWTASQYGTYTSRLSVPTR